MSGCRLTGIGKRAIPWDHTARNTKGLVSNNFHEAILLWVRLADELVGPASIVSQRFGAKSNLKRTEGAKRRTERDSSQLCERIAVHLDQIGELEHAVATSVGVSLAPCLEGGSSSIDGSVYIGLAGKGHVASKNGIVLGVANLELLAVLRVDKLKGM